jgi:tripartite-type tricarboxylate transporter receptor subunit TctC
MNTDFSVVNLCQSVKSVAKVFGVLFIAAGMVLGEPASAQTAPSFPNKTIRIIVAFTAGGPTDGIARTLAQDMSVMLGQSVVVENRTGANGQIGTVAAARATPDGYTLIYNSLNHTINSLLMKNPGYDPVKDFAPITLSLFSSSVLVVGASQPWQSLQDLVNASKSNAITFGSAGIGGSAHLTAELFRSQAGLKMTHVPFRGNGQALVDVIAGQVSFIFHPMGGIHEYVTSKRVRALAITTPQRHALYPDTPTMKEMGFSGFDEAQSWSGMLAPAGTPRAIVDKLSGVILKSMNSGALKKRAETYGQTLVGGTPDDFRKFLINDAERWRRVLRSAGIQPE